MVLAWKKPFSYMKTRTPGMKQRLGKYDFAAFHALLWSGQPVMMNCTSTPARAALTIES